LNNFFIGTNTYVLAFEGICKNTSAPTLTIMDCIYDRVVCIEETGPI
jgi:hypothetical protein